MGIVYKNDACAHVLQRKSSKMKELLTVVSLLLSGVVAEAPYEPSGWRPNGPSFELPQRIPAQVPQKQEYLPPVDPRRPVTPPEFDSGVDVSVQGLPTGEQQPIFQVSPINGQQYSGPNYQADIRSLDQTLQQIQYQQQLEKQREFARQRQFEAARGNTRANGLPNPQPPRSFVPQATPSTTTTLRPEPRTEATTESDLNEGEEYDETKDSAPKQKVSVEVTKQNIQEYPPQLFLAPLAQFKAQPQFIQLPQLGQLRAPVYYQPIQEPERQQSEGFNGPAHFAALPSVLAQQQLAQSQPAPQPQPINQNPAFIIARGQEPASAYLVPAQQEPLNQPLNQYQPVQPQPQQPLNQYQPFNNQFQPQQEPLNQYQPFNNQFQPVEQPQQEPINQFQINSQYQPLIQPQAFPQFQAQPVVLPPQTANQLPNQYAPAQQPDVEEVDEEQERQPESRQPHPQPQFIYQQPEVYNPQVNQYQPQQAGFVPQPQTINFPAQDWNQYYRNQYPQQFDSNPQGNEGQGSLQSGLDVNQQGNGIEQKENEDPVDEQNDGSRATAVATAFGTRTQPRVFLQYGAPASRPQGNPGFSATTESPQEEVTEDGPAIAQATAVATGSRKSAKLRSRRVRPIFTLDRSGHLVLAQEQ